MVAPPAFRVSANGVDITGTILPRYVSLKVVDETGTGSDSVEITLADSDPANPIRKPPKGAELEVWMGYSPMVRMGTFVVDEVEISGWPGQMVIRARAATFERSKAGNSDLQTQKTRDWPKGTKLTAMVSKIAKDHGMSSSVAKSLQGITLPHFDQTEESDISFLIRVCKKFDAIAKPAAGKIVVTKTGEGKTTSGEDMPTITVVATACTRWSMNESAKEENGTVVAFYHDRKAAKRKEVKAGSGDPVRKLRHNYPDQATAEKAAQAELDRRGRQKNKFTCTMPGNPYLTAEAKLLLSGFHPDVPLSWTVTRVEHTATPAAGYTCDLEGEVPKGDTAPETPATAPDTPAPAPAPAPAPVDDRAQRVDQLATESKALNADAHSRVVEGDALAAAGDPAGARAKYLEAQGLNNQAGDKLKLAHSIQDSIK